MTVEFGPVSPVWSAYGRGVSLGQEVAPADVPMMWDTRMMLHAFEVPEIVVTGAGAVYAFLIGDLIDTVKSTAKHVRAGNYGRAALGGAQIRARSRRPARSQARSSNGCRALIGSGGGFRVNYHGLEWVMAGR